MPVAGDPVRRWHAELAWLQGQGVRADVLIEASGRHFTAVRPGRKRVPRCRTMMLPIFTGPPP